MFYGKLPQEVTAMSSPTVHNADELEALALERGLLPFFACDVPNCTIEDFTPSKLFNKQAGLVSRAWYPDLANYRRDGYDFDARYEDGLASYKDKCVMDVLLQDGPTLTKDLKKAAGFGGDGMKGFETVITRLQMQTYVTVHSFEYSKDKHGKPYGWGVARYAVTEDVLGAEVTRSAYRRDPAESKARLLAHLRSLCPQAVPADLEKLIR